LDKSSQFSTLSGKMLYNKEQGSVSRTDARYASSGCQTEENTWTYLKAD